METVALCVGLSIGGILLLAVVLVFLKNGSLGVGGIAASLVGVILLGLSFWKSVDISVSSSGISANFESLERRVDAVGSEVGEVSRHVDSIAKSIQKRTLDLTQYRLHEPSAVSNTNLSRENPLVLVADDEEPGLFLLEKTTESFQVHGPLRFTQLPGFQGKDPNDLEALCFNGLHYFATTSHRRLGENHKAARRLIRFTIDPDWDREGYAIKLQPGDVRDLSPSLGRFLGKNKIVVPSDRWRSKGIDERHPYALEIEGLACRGEKLLLGLKWPLADGKAILAEYDWESDQFLGSPASLDLLGKGISGMHFDPQRKLLFVLANPPSKVYDSDGPEVADLYFGSSDIFAFSLTGDAKTAKLITKSSDYSRRGSKLEGITIVDDDMWLAYDGRTPAIVVKRYEPLRRSLAEP